MAGNKNWTWQLRDRKGRWIDMGRGVKWYDSTRKKEVSGTVVGSDKEGTAIVELTSEPAVNGKPQRATIQTNQVEAIKSKARIGVPATSPATVDRSDLNEDGLTDAEDDEVERLSGLIDRAEKAGQYDKTVRQEEQREAILQKGRKRLDGEEVAEDNEPKATTAPAEPKATTNTPSESDEDEFPEVTEEVRNSLKPEYGAKVQHGGGADFKGNYLTPEDAEKFPVGTQIFDGDLDDSGLKSDKTWTKIDENTWVDQRGDLFSDDEQTYSGDPYEVYLPGNPDNLTRPSDVAKASTEPESEPEIEEAPEPDVEPAPEPTPEPEATTDPAAIAKSLTKNQKDMIVAMRDAGWNGGDRRIKTGSVRNSLENRGLIRAGRSTDTDERGITPAFLITDKGKEVADVISPAGEETPKHTPVGGYSPEAVKDGYNKPGPPTPEAPQEAPKTSEAPATPKADSNASETPSESVEEAFERLGIERTEPVTLEGEKFPPTRQQQDIIDAVLAGKNTSVQAKAGTGKTTTLEALAKRVAEQDPNKKIAYIAFNKTVQLEAEGRMPSNVEARTGHSIAHAWAEPWMKKRSNDSGSLRRADDVAGHLGIRQTVRDGEGEPLSAKEQALAAMRTVDKYSNSAEDTIDASHLPEKITGENAQKAVLDAANKIWEDLKNPNGKLKFSLDNMRKMWALSRPDLSKNGSGLKRGADIVFMDEAQDTPPVLARVMDEQKAQKVVVGDSDQNIYSSFTGSIDYMKQTDKDVELPLTKSWRFGPEVADVGNRFLQLAGSSGRVEGGGPSSAIGPIEEPDAILVRSNGGMIGEILAELEKGRSVGVPSGTKKDLLSLVNTASYLKTGNYPPSKMHDDLAAFKNWEEVIEEAEKGDNAKVSMIAKLVSQHGTGGLREIINQVVETGGSGLPGVTYKDMPHGRIAEGNTYKNWGALRDAGFKLMPNPEGGVYSKGKNAGKQREAWTAVGTKEERDAMVAAANGESPVDVTISTAHKSKGLEWGKVKIGDDFRGPKVNEETGETIMPSDEEMRLAYVAVTRAEKELDPGSLGYVFDYTDENGGIPAPSSPETNDQAQEREKPLTSEPDEGTDSGPATEEEAVQEAPPAEAEAGPESVPAEAESAPEEEASPVPEEAPTEAPEAEEIPSAGPDAAPETETTPEEVPDTGTGPSGVAPEQEFDWSRFILHFDNNLTYTQSVEMAKRIGDEEMGYRLTDENDIIISDPEEALDTFEELLKEVTEMRLPSVPGSSNKQYLAIKDMERLRDVLASEMEKHSPYSRPTSATPEPAPDDTQESEQEETPTTLTEPEEAPEPETAPTPAPVAEEEPEETPAPAPETTQAPTPSAPPSNVNPIVGKAANYPDGTQLTDMKSGEMIEKTNGEWHEAGDVSRTVDPASMANLVTTDMPAQDKKSFEPFGGIDSLERGDIILTSGGSQASVVGKKDGKVVVYPHNVPESEKALRPSIAMVTTDKISGVNKFNGTGEEAPAAPKQTPASTPSSSTPSTPTAPRPARPSAPNASPSNRGRTDLELVDSRGNVVVIGDTVTSSKGDTGVVFAVRPSDSAFGSVKFRMADGSIKTVRGNKMTKRDAESEADAPSGPDVSGMKPGEGGMAPDGRMFLVSKNGKPVYKGDRVTLADGSMHVVQGVYVGQGSLGFKYENGKPYRKKASTVFAEDDGPEDNGGEETPPEDTPTPDPTPTATPDTFNVPEADRFPSEILDRANKSFEEMELDTFGALEQLPSKFAEPIGRFLNNDMTLAEVHELVLNLANSARYKAMAAKTGGGGSDNYYATSRALRNLKYQLDADFPLPTPDLGGTVAAADYDGSEGVRDFNFASSPLNPVSPAASNFTMPKAEKSARHRSANPATTAEGVTLRDGSKVWDRETGQFLGMVVGIAKNDQGTFAMVVASNAQQRRLQGSPATLTRQFGTLEARDQSWDTSEDIDFSNTASGAEIDTKLAEKYPGVEFNLKDGDDELSKQYGNTVSKLFNKYPALATSMTGVGYNRFPPAVASWAAAQRSISLNANHLDSIVTVNNINLQNFVTNTRKNSNSGFYNNVPEGREMEYAVTHELGHALDYRVGNLTTGRLHAIISEVWGKGDASEMSPSELRRNIKGMVSDYSLNADGSIFDKELVAESFADVELNGADAKPISKAVHYALMEELRSYTTQVYVSQEEGA